MEVGNEVRIWWGDIFQVIYYWTEEPGRWVAFSQLYLCPIFGLRRRNSGNLGPKERDEWRAGRSKEGEEQKIPTEFNTFGRCRSWCSANFFLYEIYNFVIVNFIHLLSAWNKQWGDFHLKLIFIKNLNFYNFLRF